MMHTRAVIVVLLLFLFGTVSSLFAAPVPLDGAADGEAEARVLLGRAAAGATTSGLRPERVERPQSTGGVLPAVLTGTWFSGHKLPYDFFDPLTGEWANPTGLGQEYVFEPDGTY